MITDEIDIALKQFKKEYGEKPSLLILGRFSYAQLLEDKGMEIEDILNYAGLEVVIKPCDEPLVKCF